MKKIFLRTFLLLILLATLILVSYNENIVQAKSSSYTSDVQLLARAINGEARGEPYEGQVAVGAVILNRMEDSRFPNTIAGVIYQSRSIYSGSRWTNKCANCRKFNCI